MRFCPSRRASPRGVRRPLPDGSLQYGGATLVFGTGPHWNYGLPSLATLRVCNKTPIGTRRISAFGPITSGLY
jgi:hypothetical protein